MSEIKLCAQCKADIPQDAVFGLCQKCLYDLAVQPPPGTLPHSERSFSQQNRRFADYQLGRQIGRGGMGVVYAAIQVSLRRPVALKMILDSHVDSPIARRRFTIEAEAAAKLDHPNIVPIYEVGEHEDQPFLSMKLVQGESLKDKLARGELCLASKHGELTRSELRNREIAVARLMATVARAVEHAHERGVLHRDLKPGNILVDNEGQPHLTDFGLAKILDQASGSSRKTMLTVEGTAMGTPNYMSPEQASGQPLAAASDIYSLGAVLYEMLSGQPPFKAATPLETLRLVTDQQARRPSTLLEQIDRDLETVCLKCLEKNADARYHSAGALAEDLERWLRHEPIRARPAGPGKRVSRWIKRNPLGAGLIVSLCAGLAVALVLLHSTNKQKKRLDLIGYVHEYDFTSKIDKLWMNPNQSSVDIPSSELKALKHLEPRDPALHAERLILALRITEDPLGQAMNYAPLLDLIEAKMEKELHRPVAFDMRLYKAGADPEPPVAQGDADFQRIGALAYIRARQAAPDLRPVVREQDNREAVIYARKETGITSLLQVKGHSVIFTHTNSTISFMAKVYFAQAGVCASNLSGYKNLDRIDPTTMETFKGNPTSRHWAMDSEGLAHKELTRQVLAGKFEVGEIQRAFFPSYQNRGGRHLVEIFSYRVPSNVFVARAGLSPEIILAFQQAMAFLSKKEKKLLEVLRTSLTEGYELVSDSDYNQMRADLTNWFNKFESGLPGPPAEK